MIEEEGENERKRNTEREFYGSEEVTPFEVKYRKKSTMMKCKRYKMAGEV
jgi:hypothetical protein